MLSTALGATGILQGDVSLADLITESPSDVLPLSGSVIVARFGTPISSLPEGL